ncbi:MAG: cell division protein FtsZ [Alphaproteobacteria bacterium]
MSSKHEFANNHHENLSQADLLKPRITIFGVGGAGGNAINNMIRANLEGVEFVAANTDAQSISNSLAKNKIQLGLKTTRGLGAGSFPDRGRASAEENIEEIQQFLEGANMVFIAAGMGGGTGTGAAPVIAKLARERDILTVGVVTKPFHFEGKYRMETADAGIEELKKYVDTLIVIPNQNLFRVANEHTTFESAFKMADDVLHAGVRGITDLITMPGLVNLDFADIRTIMTKMGKAMMGTGEATGENRALDACEAAISNPLLDNISIKGAKGVLVNMTGGPDMTLFEADIAVNAIKKEVDANANIIFGSAFNENMKGKIRISVVATGIDVEEFKRDNQKNLKEIFENNKNDSRENRHDHHENNRFKISGHQDKTSNDKSFFDTGVLSEPVLDEIEEIDQENFGAKKTYITSHSVENNHELENDVIDEENHDKPVSLANNSFDIFDDTEESVNEDEDQKPDNAHLQVAENHSKKKSEKESKPLKTKAKKDSNFSLFGFMNSSKNKASSIDEDEISDEEVVIKPVKNHKVIKNSINLANQNNFSQAHKVKKDPNRLESSIEAEKKRKQFFGETIFDEDEDHKNNDSFEEDILSVPAFLRRKK